MGVDPLSRRELWRILRDMRDRTGMTVLVSTAYLNKAEAANRTILCWLIAKGNPKALAEPGPTWLARPNERRTLPLARTLMREVRAADPRAPGLMPFRTATP
ncbi:MAG: hypothetical protein V8T46_06575 [Sutterella seckii]